MTKCFVAREWYLHWLDVERYGQGKILELF